MLKRDRLYRRLADEAILSGRRDFTQAELAAALHMSAGNVHRALVSLRQSGAVEVRGKRLLVHDVPKILLTWAAQRSPQQVIAGFDVEGTTHEALKMLPPGLTLTSFAGVVERYGVEPAPLACVRAYARPGDDRVLAALRSRFLLARNPARATIVIMEADDEMAETMPEVASPAQLYVDSWWEPGVYAPDYMRAIAEAAGL